MIAIYARQSVDKKNSISIEAQIELCKKEFSSSEPYKVFSDKGFSGKNINRPNFKLLLEEVKSNKIEKIVVYRLDRISRSIIDFGQVWDLLQKYNVEFTSVNEKFDTSTPMGKAMLHIIMVFAQLERETIAERIKDNYYQRIKYGSWPGGPAPYGFDNGKITLENGKVVSALIPNDKLAVVRIIFEEYAKENTSLGTVAKILTAEGIEGIRRKTWDSISISRILHSPVYVMADADVYLYYQNKGMNFSNNIDDFTGDFSAHITGRRLAYDRSYTSAKQQTLSLTNFRGIIESELWLKCQNKLDKNTQIKNFSLRPKSWLSGFLKCGNCGYAISISNSHDKTYLRCSGRYNLHICGKTSYDFTIEEVEYSVQNELEKVISKYDALKQEQFEEVIPESNSKKIEYIEIEQKIQNLMNSLENASTVTMFYINREIEKLDLKRKELLKFINEEPKKKNNFKNIDFSTLSIEDKRLVLDSFVKKILIFDDYIEIVWRV